MPLIQISMASGRTDAQKRALLEAITSAVQESIGAPIASIRIWIHEFEPTEYMAAGVLMADRPGSTATPGHDAESSQPPIGS